MSDDIERDEIIQGFLYAHTRSNLNTIEAHRAQADVQALLEVLVARGLISREEYEAQRESVDAKLRQDFVEKGMAVAVSEQEASKYGHQESIDIDCETRVALCKAACCRLSFALSKEDVEEAVVKWDLGRPYIIAQGSDGYCTHLSDGARACRVYEHRPLTCRKFDCRNDTRIWRDFEQRVPNPDIGQPGWPQTTEQD